MSFLSVFSFCMFLFRFLNVSFSRKKTPYHGKRRTTKFTSHVTYFLESMIVTIFLFAMTPMTKNCNLDGIWISKSIFLSKKKDSLLFIVLITLRKINKHNFLSTFAKFIQTSLLLALGVFLPHSIGFYELPSLLCTMTTLASFIKNCNVKSLLVRSFLSPDSKSSTENWMPVNVA